MRIEPTIGSTAAKALDMNALLFPGPALNAFCLLDRLGLTVTNQFVAGTDTVLTGRVVEPNDATRHWCWRSGVHSLVRDTIVLRLAHAPLGCRPTVLAVGCTAAGPRVRPRVVLGHHRGGAAALDAVASGGALRR